MGTLSRRTLLECISTVPGGGEKTGLGIPYCGVRCRGFRDEDKEESVEGLADPSGARVGDKEDDDANEDELDEGRGETEVTSEDVELTKIVGETVVAGSFNT